MTGAASESTPSGIEAVGDLPWGSHFCQFYESGGDLRSALVPFFKAGLENNERCIWVTADPLREDDARSALNAVAPALPQLERSGQVEIVDCRRWYERASGLAAETVIGSWLDREREALAAGYKGLRITGNVSFLQRTQWDEFADYERHIQDTFRGRHIVALCSYCLSQCRGSDVLDVVRNHSFALIRRHDAWEVVESAALAAAKEDLHRSNLELERRVAERTSALERAVEALSASERHSRDILEALPAAVYTTDAKGRITFYNQAAVDLSGRRPELGSDKWCVTWRLFRTDGTPLAPDECPMALPLKEEREIRGWEAVAERPDGTRVPFIPYPSPLRDASGAMVGAVNMLVDISERKNSETQMRLMLNELNHRVKNNMQTLYSLLWTAQRECKSAEARALLMDAGRRVSAMAAAHQALYLSHAPGTFEAEEFLTSVCQGARHTFSGNVEIVREAATGRLSVDTAVPLALILNELLTNAVKHGAGSDGACRIRVGLSIDGESFVLAVEDDGPGFDLPAVSRRSSGLGLVSGLARQLGGTLQVARSPGARCTVRFCVQSGIPH